MKQPYPMAKREAGDLFQFVQRTGDWKRAGTLNLNLRYGQMTMALVAQAALHPLRRRPGEPFAAWDASHWARSLLGGLEGDVRVTEDTIVVT